MVFVLFTDTAWDDALLIIGWTRQPGFLFSRIANG